MKEKPEIAYHFTGNKLRNGRPLPAIGEWLVETGEIRLCERGLHASRTPFQALSFAPGFKLHKVEVREIVTETDDKLVARQRKILMTIDAKDLILSFARKQALSVCHLFDCPPVLKKWLETGDESTRKGAKDAATAAYAAANTAYTYTGAAYAYAAAAAAYAAHAAAYATAAYTAYTAYTAAADADYANKKKAVNMFNQAVEEAFRVGSHS